MGTLCLGSYVYVENTNTVDKSKGQSISTIQSIEKQKKLKEQSEDMMARMIKEELDKIQNKIDGQGEQLVDPVELNKRENTDINNPKQVQTVKEYEEIQQADMISLYEMLEKPINKKQMVLYFSPLDINFKDKNYNVINNNSLEGWNLPENINTNIKSFLVSQDRAKTVEKKNYKKISKNKKTVEEFKNPDDMSVQEKTIYNLVLYIAHAYDLDFDLAQQITEQSYELGDKYQMQPVFLLSFMSMQIRFYEDYKKKYYGNKANIERDVKALHQLIEKHGYQKDMTPVIMDFNTMYEDTARKFNEKIKEAYKNMSRVVESTNVSAKK